VHQVFQRRIFEKGFGRGAFWKIVYIKPFGERYFVKKGEGTLLDQNGF